jgi:signal transduction histidine kinase/CheY-like chemotaxis protein
MTTAESAFPRTIGSSADRRWWVWPSIAIFVLQILALAFLRFSNVEPQLENVFDVILCGISAVVSWQAAARSHGVARVLFRTLALCSGVFAIALALGSYPVNWPYHQTLTELSDEVSVFWLAPLSLTLFLEPDFDLKKFDYIHLLDFAQIVVFWVAVYFFFLFLPIHVFANEPGPHTWLQQTWAGSLVYDVSMTMLFLLRGIFTASRAMRRLFIRSSIFLAAACIADLYANYNRLQSGTWYQMVWTALNIAPIVLAGTWKQDANERMDESMRGRSIFGDQLFPVMTAFLVLLLSMVIMRERLTFALGMVSISFACSSVRMVVVQFRELRIADNLQLEISERRRAEQLLRENEEHLEEQVTARTKELRTANEQLRSEIGERQRLEEQLRHTQKMEAIGTLSGGIAHDFNNLLTVIRGYARMVLDRVGHDAELKADVEQIDEAGARAAALTSQLLAFSRRQMLQPRTLHLQELVNDVEKMLRRLIGEHIDLATRTERDLGAVKADPGQMEQVIMNLVVNARDAMPRGGHLLLETANVHLDEKYAREHVDVEPGDYVMLAVHDNGIGMDASIQAHIFEPFFTTKERARGTGLGLAMVYGIVKQSGGSIAVESALGKGSVFRIYLPRVQRRKELPAGTSPGSVRQGSESVLLVEDDDQVRGLTVSMLKRCGYTVYVAENGTEALRFSDQHTNGLDLLLTDVVMPGVSGPDLAKKMTTRHPGLKVLFMSGYTDDAIGDHGMLGEGIALLQKPFTSSMLAERVREVLDAKSPRSANV